MIFAHVHLDYASVHTILHKFVSAVAPGGLFVFGHMPADEYVPKEDPAYDATGTYVENYPAPFMGQQYPTFMMNRAGQIKFLTSMGLDIIYEATEIFQPALSYCVPEHQQYIIARRISDAFLEQPLPLPISRNSASGCHRKDP